MADDIQNDNFQWIPAQMPQIFEDAFAESAFTQGSARETLVTCTGAGTAADAD